MFTSAEELLAFVKEEGIETIDCRFCDLPGVMQHFTVPAGSFGPEVFTEGLSFDGSSIAGFQKIHESDMALLPDPTSAFVDPFRKSKTLNINFFVHDPLTKEPYSRDPRNIARKAEAYLISTGIAETAFFAPEAEFYVFDDIRFDSTPNASYYHIDSEAGAWNSGRVQDGGNRGYKVKYKGGYFPVAPVDHFGDLSRFELADGEIVKKEQRLCALHKDVVHAHGDGVDADGVVLAEGEGDFQFGADAVGAGDEDGVFVAAQVVKGAKGADLSEDAGVMGRARVLFDAGDGVVARFFVHPRAFVVEAHASSSSRSSRRSSTSW